MLDNHHKKTFSDPIAKSNKKSKKKENEEKEED